MQRESVKRRGTLRDARMPGNLLLLREKLQNRGGQDRYMHGMAYRTRGVRRATMLVQQSAAACEIQQCNAAQQSESTTPTPAFEFQPQPQHRYTV
jgi:hypothetical protein